MTRTSPDSGKKSDRRMTIVLALVIVAAISIALAKAGTSRGASIPADDRVAPLSPGAESAEPPPGADGALSGEVLETIPVSKYIYLHMRGAEGEIWAAVPSASVAIGSRVTISNATRMDDFRSATLGRSFKVIYFGTLGAASGPAAGDGVAAQFPFGDEPEVDPDQSLPAGHPEIGVTPAPLALTSGDALPLGHPDIGSNAASPHGEMGDAPGEAGPLPSSRIARASGGNGHLIAELVSNRQKLAGQRVRVRGQVTKVTPNVQGYAFFHLRDDTVSGNGAPSDLVVTAKSPPTRGQVATFEGTLRSDDDIGVGYKYPVLIEDATVVGEGN
jgi:hypothetical protein